MGLKCSGEMNSPCAKVLPWRAKRLYGAYAPPHLRWGPFVDDKQLDELSLAVTRREEASEEE